MASTELAFIKSATSTKVILAGAGKTLAAVSPLTLPLVIAGYVGSILLKHRASRILVRPHRQP